MRLKLVAIVALVAMAACSGSSPSPQPAPAPSRNRESGARQGDAAKADAAKANARSLDCRAKVAGDAEASCEVVAAPTELDADHIFAGRVLATGTDRNVFCVSTYFDSSRNRQVHSVELIECSYAEDEVAVLYVEDGKPTIDDASAELGGRFDDCLEAPKYLPMVRWPASSRELVVRSLKLRADFDGSTLRLWLDDPGGEPTWTLDVPNGQIPESLHVADNFIVARMAGTSEGKPVSDCHVTR